MTEEIKVENKKLAYAKDISSAFFTSPSSNSANPWSNKDVDKLEFNVEPKEDFQKEISASRFFYKKDPIAATVINKLVDIGITEILFTKGKLSDNEYKIFLAIKDTLQEFAESMALEFLISGLVVPEVTYGVAPKDTLAEYGIKKYEHLILPLSMWVRDPATIKINSIMVGSEPSYYVIIPEKLIYFIMNKGIYPDGTEDKKLYAELNTYFPEFVSLVEQGAREVLLDNNLIFRRRVLSNSPYPTPYLSPAIEDMKHKRNLRRMDYAIASRVIGAIQLIRLGNDTYPVTEEDEEQFSAIKQQMFWRDSGERDVERIFQLFGNHTLDITWVMPDFQALLNESKYKDINTDILFALGMPRTLLVGEAEKSNTGSNEYVALSPVKTMEAMRRKILKVINDVVTTVADENNLKYIPTARFKPLRLENFQAFVGALYQLYITGNLSRTSYADALGFNFGDEALMRSEENELITSLGVETFAPQPFAKTQEGNTPQSNAPQSNAPKNPPKDNTDKNTAQ